MKGGAGQIGACWGCRQTFHEGSGGSTQSVSLLPLPGVFQPTEVGRGSQGRIAKEPLPSFPPARGRAGAAG